MWLKAGFVSLVRAAAGLEWDGLGRCVWRKGSSEVRRNCRIAVGACRGLLWNSGWRESSWGESTGKCVVHLLWLRGSWTASPEGWHNPGGAAGLCLGPGLLTEGNLSAPHAALTHLSSSFWALLSGLQMAEFISTKFCSVIRIETCHIFVSIHTFGHGFLSLHLSQCSICLFLTASACWADVFREPVCSNPQVFFLCGYN